MASARAVKVFAPVAGLALLAACGTATSNSSSSQVGDSSGWTVEAEPDGGGAAVLTAIDMAKQSIDIPIYSIVSSSGEDLSFTGHLLTAKSHGVNIRIMMNGGYGHAIPAVAQAYLTKLQAAPGTGTVGVNYSSNNFNITHQKSVITDAADKNGQPLAASLPPSARLVVSTGNFSSGYPKTNPWYHARDFEMTSMNPADITLSEQTFVSDFTCAGPSVIQPPNEQASDRLIWSNGTTGKQANPTLPTPENQYPTAYDVYDNVPETATYPSIKGNVRAMQQNLITSAVKGDTLKIYNEEFSDPNSLNLLTNAIGRGVNVQVTMTAASPPTPTRGSPSWDGELKIAKAGGVVHLFTNNTIARYIHAKAIILVPAGSTNATAAYAGSTNLAAASMNFNRELGVNFNLSTGDEAAINALNNTFNTDWSQVQDVTVWNSTSQPFPPTVAKVQQVPDVNLQPGALGDTPPAVCGSVAGSQKKK